ncbi:Hpt domain-containing protein [Scytonema sp. NUACC21]
MEAAKVAIATSDFQLFAKEAHHLKGSSANVGAKAIHQIAEQLEQLARFQDFRGTSQLISQLEESIFRLQAFLKNLE